MFTERFPAQEHLRETLEDHAKQLEALKGLSVSETSIDQDGEVTITFSDGKKLVFGTQTEDYLRMDNLHIE